MTTQDLSLCIVIASKDRANEIARCIASIRAQPTQPDEIVVVDQSKERYSIPDEHVSHIYAPNLSGLTQARNLATRYVRSDTILFLDDDTELLSDCVAEVRAAWRHHPDAAGMACRVKSPSVRALRALRGQIRQSFQAMFEWGFFNSRPIRRKEGVEVRTAPGCAMAFRTALFEEVQADERLAGHSLGEDWELSLRARRHGPIWMVDKAIVMHYQAPSNRPSSPELLMARWNNFQYFFDKHHAGASLANRVCRVWWMIGESLRWLTVGMGFPILGIRGAAVRAVELRPKPLVEEA
jgi:GT2 family glycosyltransferase